MYLVLLFIAYSTSILARTNTTDSVRIQVHLKAKKTFQLGYLNEALQERSLIFRNKSLRDSTISISMTFEKPREFVYNMVGIDKNYYYNFVLSPGEGISLEPQENLELTCLNPDRKLVFANKELFLVDFFNKEQEAHITNKVNTGVEVYDNFLDGIYTSNSKKIDSMAKLQLITNETEKTWRTLILADYYRLLFYPIWTSPSAAENVTSFKQKVFNANEKLAQLKTINNYALRHLYIHLTKYEALSLGKQTSDLAFHTQYLLNTNWGNEVIITSMTNKLDEYPEKNSPEFKKSFESFRSFCKKNGKEEIAIKLYAKYYPETNIYNTILLVDSIGKPSTLAEVLQKQKGKLIFLDLWASWCSPCRAELPVLEKMKKKFPNQHIEFISISLDKNAATKAWTTALKQENLTDPHQYRMLDVSNPALSKTFQVKSIPRYLVFDRKGNILNDNFPRPSEENFESKLQTYLKL